MPAFEYVVTKPRVSADVTGTDDAETDIIISERISPLIILLGWTGSHDRHVAKYGEFYDAAGFATLRYCVPVMYVMMRQDKIQGVAKKLLAAINGDEDLKDRPIIIHAFSNGGALVYRELLCRLRKGEPANNNIKLIGVIFDSCPAPNNFRLALRSFRSMTTNMGSCQSVCLLTAGTFAILFTGLPIFWPHHIRCLNFWRCLTRDVGPHAFMYLYSTADEVVSYKQVERMIKSKVKSGAGVTAHKWHDTEHVSHIKTHRDEYIGLCLDFVKGCIDGLPISL